MYIKFSKSDALLDKDKFVSNIINKAHLSVGYIEDTLALFQRNKRCNWRSKSIADDIIIGEIALSLAKELVKGLGQLSLEDRTAQVARLLEFRDHCIDALESYNISTTSDESMIAKSNACSMSSTLDALALGKQSVFYGYDFIHAALRKVIVSNLLIPDWESYCSLCWLLPGHDQLMKRLDKYDIEVPNPLSINTVDDFYKILVHGIDFLGYRLQGIIYTIKNAKLSNTSNALANGSKYLERHIKGHYPKVLITDGDNIAVLYDVPNPKTKRVAESWITPSKKVDFSAGYRVFIIKAHRNNAYEFIDATPAEVSTYLIKLRTNYNYLTT